MTSFRAVPVVILLLSFSTLLRPVCAQIRQGKDVTALASISFWMAPEHKTVFEAAYESRLLPILRRHGLRQETRQQGRVVVDSVFSRLFVMASISEIREARTALLVDTEYLHELEEIGLELSPDPEPFGGAEGIQRRRWFRRKRGHSAWASRGASLSARNSRDSWQHG